jgi:hypothetical protein
MASDVQTTAEKGRRAVIEALRDRGAEVSESRRGNLRLVVARSPAPGGSVHVRVKTRTAGTWQSSIRDADPDPAPTRPETFWAFVDLKNPRNPQFYIVPDTWMRQDIHRAHQAYLRRHGCERAITQDSVHHAIELRRILQWKDRWELLGLS